MINSNFDLELIKDDKKKKVKVVMQEVSPFRVADMFSSGLDIQSRNYRIGYLTELFMEEIIVAPKNLKEQIEESDNAIGAISDVFTEVKKFCESPKQYALLQTESEIKAKNMEHSTSEHDTNGSEKHD
jgi:hypothetical protein